MRDLNIVTLIGRLTQDPRLTYTQTQKRVCTFSIAVNRDKEGVDFINVVAWEGLAEAIAQYCKKGHQIAIKGQLRTRNYDDNGRKVYVTEVLADGVTFLQRKESDNQEPKKQNVQSDPFANTQSIDIDPDDLPFY